MTSWQLKVHSAVHRRDTLGNEYFAGAVLAAFLIHIFAYYIWYVSPKPQVIDVPVRALNLKLGEVDTMTEVDVKLLEPSKVNHTRVETLLSKLVRSQEKEKTRSNPVVGSMDKAMDNPNKPKKKAPPLPAPAKPQKSYKFDVRNEGTKAAAPVIEVSARQFVREQQVAKPDEKAAGVAGNSKEKEAEVMARYEQLISLWIQKFKIYPESAKQAGKNGQTVARIRIDRRGNIHYYTLERSTGHLELDKAAIDMIKRANPVPAAPTNYPPGDVLEFRIPIRFDVK